MLKYTRDYFSHSQQGLSCTKNVPYLGVNNFHIWHVIDMGISQFESLFLFKMKNTFYFILKALSVLKIFKLLSRPFGHVGKTA